MTASLPEIVGRLRSERAALRKIGVRHLVLFGSVARGEAKPDSDVDIAVEIEPGTPFSLFLLEDTRLRLSQLLGQQVDLGEIGCLREEARASFEQDKVAVF